MQARATPQLLTRPTLYENAFSNVKVLGKAKDADEAATGCPPGGSESAAARSLWPPALQRGLAKRLVYHFQL
jgi:hypothetical protein